MKIFSLFFLFFVLVIFNASAQTTIDKLIATRHDDFNNNTWIGIDSTTISRNVDGFITNSLSIKTDANFNWNNWYKYTYTLSASNKKLQQIRENWNGSSWVNNTRYTYTYDANDNEIQQIYDVWNGSTWAQTGKIEHTGYNTFGQYSDEILSNMINTNWVNATKKTLSYTTSPLGVSNTTSDERYNWNTTTATWDKNQRFTYTYTLDSVHSSMIHSLPDNSANWENESKIIYTYQTVAPFLQLEYRKQLWDTTTLAWFDNSRITYAYTTTNKLASTLSENAGSTSNWDPTFRTQYVYNTNDFVQEYFDQWNVNGNWENNTQKLYTYIGNYVSKLVDNNGNGSAWNNASRTAFLYDGNNNNTFKQVDSFVNGNYQNDARYFYYYQAFPLGFHSVSNLITNVVNYPNPCSDILSIKINTKKIVTVQITIADISGKSKMEVIQPLFLGENKINTSVSSLPDGNYILSISDNEGKIYQQKITVLK